MQMTFNLELWPTLILIGLGFLAAALVLLPLAYLVQKRRIMALKVSMMQRLPMTLDKIDADKEVIRAHHVVELCRLELRIAELAAAEAEAKAQVHESLSRIDKLNRRVEILQLKLAAKRVNREIRSVDEQLILLDGARDTADSATIA